MTFRYILQSFYFGTPSFAVVERNLDTGTHTVISEHATEAAAKRAKAA